MFTKGIGSVQVQNLWVHYAQMKGKCNYSVQFSSGDHYVGLRGSITKFCL
jgi:hypothetical protein